MIQTKKLYKKLSKKSSKSNKKDKSEYLFDKLQRERKEREAKERQAQEKAVIAAKKEEERKHKIIYEYVEKLDNKLKKTIDDGFFSFVDDPKFTKLCTSHQNIKKMLKSNPEKYAGRHIAEFYIKSYHNKRNEKHLFHSQDTWISGHVYIYEIDNKGKYTNDPIGGGNFVWLTDDFKITKFSYKFYKFLMHVFDTGVYNFSDLGGVSLSFLINQLKKRGVKFDDILQPLAGV